MRRDVQHVYSLITYLDNNRDGVHGVKNAPEAAGYRMKKQGRTWTGQGSDNMLAALMEHRNASCAGPEIARLVEENAEWAHLRERPFVFQEACGKQRRRHREEHLPALHNKRTGTSAALRRAPL